MGHVVVKTETKGMEKTINFISIFHVQPKYKNLNVEQNEKGREIS